MSIGFDNSDIPPGQTGDAGGAVFNLPDISELDAEFETAAKERVVVQKGSTGVIVSNLNAFDYDTAWRKGLVAAQQALDVFSARGLADLYLKDPQFDHITVHGESGAQVLRVVGVSTASFSMEARGEVRNKAGELVRQPAPVSAWHESMRYYRQAQVSDDLFESFRSLWLGFENLLDTLEPASPGEREKKWLKRALAQADTKIELARFLPQGAQGNPVDTAYNYFYKDTRTHLFHAKASRAPLLPYEEVGVNLLVSRHKQLTSLYLGLLENVIGVTRPTSRLAEAGFELMATGIEKEPITMLVTDDPSPPDPNEALVNAQEGQVVEMEANREERLERPFLRMFLGKLNGADLAGMQYLRKAAFQSAGNVISLISVDGDLHIAGLAALEVQMGIRIRMGKMPRSFAEM